MQISSSASAAGSDPSRARRLARCARAADLLIARARSRARRKQSARRLEADARPPHRYYPSDSERRLDLLRPARAELMRPIVGGAPADFRQRRLQVGRLEDADAEAEAEAGEEIARATPLAVRMQRRTVEEARSRERQTDWRADSWRWWQQRNWPKSGTGMTHRRIFMAFRRGQRGEQEPEARPRCDIQTMERGRRSEPQGCGQARETNLLLPLDFHSNMPCVGGTGGGGGGGGQTPAGQQEGRARRRRASKLNSQLLQAILAGLLLLDTAARLLVTSGLVVQVSEQPAWASGPARQRGTGDRGRAANSTRQHWMLTARAKRATGDARRATAARSAKLMEVDALNYLHRYGYMNSSAEGANLISEDSFHEAIMQFQRFAGIPETGSVDALTQRFMQMPRCGNKDLSGKGENGKRRRRRRRRRRRKRYALQGSKWRRQELSYRISQYPTRFLHKKHEVDGQIERAFKIWSQVAPIDFVVKKEGRVHIDIRFASGEHGDGDPFDGPGNTLAHAYFPQYGGDAHFDDQEYWTVDSYAGTNIFQVAAHELGHSLGLGHSSVREALMAPFYQKYKPNFKLHADDVLAIQALYGERAESPAADADADSDSDGPSTSTTSSEPAPAPPARRRPAAADDDGTGLFGPTKPVDLCQDPKMDTITRTEDGNTYVFRGQYYWQIRNDGLAPGGPGKIARDWDGLPGDLDAALTWSDGKTFFFKADKYWRFTNKRRAPGYPKQISAGFAGIPNNIDAAFVWGGNGKTYFFKRDKYWRFDSKQEPPVSGQYPKPLKNWSGLPASGNIDAAFKWDNGMTYFFKDDLYWRFDDREFEVDTAARPAFPRSTSEWWFGCTNANLPIRRWPSEPSEDPDNHTSASSLLFHRKPNLTYERPLEASTSIPHSILSSLSSLFSPATSRSATGTAARDNSPSDSLEDWSFHRGVGEEVRKLLKSAHGQSRWSFPTMGGGSQSRRLSGRGEQSLSELRLAPESDHHKDEQASTRWTTRENNQGECDQPLDSSAS